MNNKRNRKLALIIAVVMLTLAFSSTGFAAWMGKTLQAQYRNITIFVNGQQKQATDVNGVIVEPFIVDGTTYVPLRGISQMLGYEVNFNPATYRIDVTGTGADPSLQYQLFLKDARIAELEAQLAEKSQYSLDDMEDDLNDDYTRFTRNVSIDEIVLKGRTSDIEIRIYVELVTDTDLNNWEKAYDDGDVKKVIQNMVDDVLDEFPDAKVEGFVQDDYDKSKVVTFTVNSRGVVSLSKSTSSSSGTLAGLKSDLEKAFVGDYGIEKFNVTGSTSSIKVDVLVNYDKWRALSPSNKNRAQNEIMDFIEYDFPKADIDGLVISNDSYKDELSTFSN